MHTGFCWRNLREADHLEDRGVAGGIILQCTFRNQPGSINCTDLVQNRDRWLALVNAVMNLRVP